MMKMKFLIILTLVLILPNLVYNQESNTLDIIKIAIENSDKTKKKTDNLLAIVKECNRDILRSNTKKSYLIERLRNRIVNAESRLSKITLEIEHLEKDVLAAKNNAEEINCIGYITRVFHALIKYSNIKENLKYVTSNLKTAILNLPNLGQSLEVGIADEDISETRDNLVNAQRYIEIVIETQIDALIDLNDSLLEFEKCD